MVILTEECEFDPIVLLKEGWNKQDVVFQKLDENLVHVLVPAGDVDDWVFLGAEVLRQEVPKVGRVER